MARPADIMHPGGTRQGAGPVTLATMHYCMETIS